LLRCTLPRIFRWPKSALFLDFIIEAVGFEV
jgi:hypothetical protein